MFKKLCAIVILALLLQNYQTDNIIFENAKGEYIFYIGSDGSNCKFVYSNSENAQATKDGLKNVSGEGVKFISEKYISETLKKYKAIEILSEEVMGVRSIYYYSNKISCFKMVCGKKVNIQIACSNDVWTIASPMIYGSF